MGGRSTISLKVSAWKIQIGHNYNIITLSCVLSTGSNAARFTRSRVPSLPPRRCAPGLHAKHPGGEVQRPRERGGADQGRRHRCGNPGARCRQLRFHPAYEGVLAGLPGPVYQVRHPAGVRRGHDRLPRRLRWRPGLSIVRLLAARIQKESMSKVHHDCAIAHTK